MPARDGEVADLLVDDSEGVVHPHRGAPVVFAACTAPGSARWLGVRAGYFDRSAWTWTVRQQTTPSPGGLVHNGAEDKRAPHGR